MAAIDYETEYDNRARVPEHPEIFARWEREATEFRDAASKRGAELGIAYGNSPRQIFDLFPAVRGADTAPLAMFVHGGWWRLLHPSMFGQTARGLNEQGITVAVAGYDLCPQVTIAQIVEQIRAACLALWRKHNSRITLFGHSAGGHLTACMVATDWKTRDPSVPADLVPSGYAISGVYDLAPLTQVSVNQDLKLDDAEARRLSPLYWRVPAGRTLDAVVGADESSEFLRQSKIIADAWKQDMVATRYEAVPGMNHFTVIDALSDPNSAMVARIAEMAKQAQSAAR